MAKRSSRQEAFDAYYKEMSRGELARQGKQLLHGRADRKAKRAGQWLWLIISTFGIAGVLLTGIVALWLLHMAQKLGTSWSETVRQAATAYTTTDE